MNIDRYRKELNKESVFQSFLIDYQWFFHMYGEYDAMVKFFEKRNDKELTEFLINRRDKMSKKWEKEWINGVFRLLLRGILLKRSMMI